MTNHSTATRAPRRSPAAGAGFTLIELMLVMTLLTIAVGLAAPALGSFFRGRALDSEARRLLALTRQGQSRAASEGLPMDLWFDGNNHLMGLEAEKSFEPQDERAVEFAIDPDMLLEALTTPVTDKGTSPRVVSVSTQPNPSIPASHPGLPRIRFLPDGTIEEGSPQKLRLTGRDGFSITLQQTRNSSSYEIAPRN